MDLQQIIAQAGGVESIAGELGISSQQANSGLSALLPAVLGGFKKNAQGGAGGLGGLMSAVEGMGGGGLMDNVLGQQPTDVSQGNNILGQIFGSKDVSRAVADHAAQQSGVDGGVLKQMLPMVAMLAAGLMAKGGQSGAGGGLGEVIGNMLGGGKSGGGGLGGMLSGVLGGGQSGQAAAAGGGLGGLGAMLDMDGDGNSLDDILGMAGKLTGH